MPANASDSLEELSSEIIKLSRKAGFALMKANYSEHHAPELPDGTILGPTPEVRDIAANLRDSIWTRFDSLRFHHALLRSVQGTRDQRLGALPPTADNFDIVWSSTWHTHYLFDDIVFNTVSLFDYLGNAIWFVFHGANHIKKKWNKTYSAAKSGDIEQRLERGRRIFGSKIAPIVVETHESFVNALYEYRSNLIHYRIDGPDVFSHEFWERSRQPNARPVLPQGYLKALRTLLREDRDSTTAPDVQGGAEQLIRHVGRVTIELLHAVIDQSGWQDGEPLMILS